MSLQSASNSSWLARGFPSSVTFSSLASRRCTGSLLRLAFCTDFIVGRVIPQRMGAASIWPADLTVNLIRTDHIFRSRTGYLFFGGLLPRPPPEGLPGFLLGALCGTGLFAGAFGGLLFVVITISITCQQPASVRALKGRGFP